MSHYSFPVLNDKELVQCLTELAMNCTMDQLNKPTYEFVLPIYENLVTALMGVTREELQQPVFAATDVLEFPELHDESIPAVAFLKHLNRLMLASGIKDFSLRVSLTAATFHLEQTWVTKSLHRTHTR
jgi:kinetochore protein Nuf2